MISSNTISSGKHLKKSETEAEAEMTVSAQIQYVSDEKGQPIGVIVPIELWREIESERETAYLFKSETMKKRLLEAKNRTGGISLEDAAAQHGI
jgi:SH3-like domain-containing protein